MYTVGIHSRSISVLIYASGSRSDGWQRGILVRNGLFIYYLLASAAALSEFQNQ